MSTNNQILEMATNQYCPLYIPQQFRDSVDVKIEQL